MDLINIPKSLIGIVAIIIVVVSVAIPILHTLTEEKDATIGTNEGSPVIIANPDSTMTYTRSTREIVIDGITCYASRDYTSPIMTIIQFDTYIVKIDSNGGLMNYSEQTGSGLSYSGRDMTYSDGVLTLIHRSGNIEINATLIAVIYAVDAESNYVMSETDINITTGDQFYIICLKDEDGTGINGVAIYSGTAEVGTVETTRLNPSNDLWGSSISISFEDNGTYVSPIIPQYCAIAAPVDYVSAPPVEPLASGSIGAMIDIIPIIMIAGLIIGVAGTFLYRRLS